MLSSLICTPFSRVQHKGHNHAKKVQKRSACSSRIHKEAAHSRPLQLRSLLSFESIMCPQPRLALVYTICFTPCWRCAITVYRYLFRSAVNILDWRPCLVKGRSDYACDSRGFSLYFHVCHRLLRIFLCSLRASFTLLKFVFCHTQNTHAHTHAQARTFTHTITGLLSLTCTDTHTQTLTYTRARAHTCMIAY